MAVDLKLEISCGAVVFTRSGGGVRYAVVEERAGTCSLPKGHMEGGETERQTAAREILEETGLRPVFLDGFRMTDEFLPAEQPGVRKRVVYFLAEFGGETPVPQPGEIRRVLILPFAEAMQALSRQGMREVLAAADASLRAEGPAERAGVFPE